MASVIKAFVCVCVRVCSSSNYWPEWTKSNTSASKFANRIIGKEIQSIHFLVFLSIAHLQPLEWRPQWQETQKEDNIFFVLFLRILIAVNIFNFISCFIVDMTCMWLLNKGILRICQYSQLSFAICLQIRLLESEINFCDYVSVCWLWNK